MKRVINWLRSFTPSGRRRRAAKKLVDSLMPSIDEVRGTNLSTDQGAFVFCDSEDGKPRPEEDFQGSYGKIVSKIAKQREKLGYNERDDLVFSVPVINAVVDGKGKRLTTDLTKAQFKKVPRGKDGIIRWEIFHGKSKK